MKDKTVIKKFLNEDPNPAYSKRYAYNSYDCILTKGERGDLSAIWVDSHTVLATEILPVSPPHKNIIVIIVPQAMTYSKKCHKKNLSLMRKEIDDLIFYSKNMKGAEKELSKKLENINKYYNYILRSRGELI